VTLRSCLPLAIVAVVICEPAAVTLAYSDARRILRAMTMLVIFAVLIGFAIKVWAENRPGGGALFRFILPLSKTAQATPRAN
jgi:hypothetical protein